MIVIISARCLNTAPAACEQMKTFGHLGHPNMRTTSTIKAITGGLIRFYCLWYWGRVLLWDFSDASAHCSERELFTLSQTFLLMLWLYIRCVGCLNRSSLCFYIRVSCYDSIFSFGWDFSNNDLMLMITNYVTRRKSHKVNQEFRLRPPTEPPCFVSLNNLFGHRKH